MWLSDKQLAELTSAKRAEVIIADMAKEFPRIVPINPRYGLPDDPWAGPTEFESWVNNNLHRFLFQIDEIVAGSVPYRYRGGELYPKGSGIYFLMMDGLIGYVGKATDLHRRLEAHYKDPSKPFTHFWCIEGVPLEAMDAVENMYMEWLRPPMNVRYRGCCEKARELIAGLEPQIPFEEGHE